MSVFGHQDGDQEPEGCECDERVHAQVVALKCFGQEALTRGLTVGVLIEEVPQRAKDRAQGRHHHCEAIRYVNLSQTCTELESSLDFSELEDPKDHLEKGGNAEDQSDEYDH